MFLTNWWFGADYAKVITLSGTSVVSVATPEDIVTEHYAEYRRQLIEGIIDKEEDESKEEYSQVNIETDEDTPTLH